MPVEVGGPKKRFGVKFVLKDEHMSQIQNVEADGRSGAKDEILNMYPGCEILEVWQDGSFRV